MICEVLYCFEEHESRYVAYSIDVIKV